MGPAGRGSHGHADTLSLCVSLRGQPVLIDPGTGIYTGHAEWRDAFRGGRMHNGVTVDGLGVCAFDDGLFRWSTLCTPRVERWEESAGWVRFSGSHDGFERIAPGLRHRRSSGCAGCATRSSFMTVSTAARIGSMPGSSSPRATACDGSARPPARGSRARGMRVGCSFRTGWRGMVIQDRIRLRGLLTENPAICRVFLFHGTDAVEAACITRASRVRKVSSRLGGNRTLPSA